MFGKAPHLLFGKDQLPVDEHIELTGLTNDQFRLNVESIFNFGRETHGTRFVVSNMAILGFDLHVKPPPETMVPNVPERKWVVEKDLALDGCAC